MNKTIISLDKAMNGWTAVTSDFDALGYFCHAAAAASSL